MLKSLTRWLEDRRQRKAAVVAAMSHFADTTGEKALAGSCCIGRESRGTVVRVCHGQQIKPHRRIWYVVGPDGRVVAELSLAEVRQFGERGWK